MKIHVYIDTRNHYRIVENGDMVEFWEHGGRCPHDSFAAEGEKHDEGTLVLKCHKDQEIVWHALKYKVTPGEVIARRGNKEDEKIFCGDDFLYLLRP